MPRIVKNIPLLDLGFLLMETQGTPGHGGTVQILNPVNGTRKEVISRILDGYRRSEVDAPFNYVPVFPRFGLPKWAECDYFDPEYHVRHLRLDSPGSEQQLLKTVMDLHRPPLGRDRPGWISYIIDGLQKNRLALYWKVQHAYLDGAAMVMRMDATVSRNPDALEAHPLWSPVFSQHEEKTNPSGIDAKGIGRQLSAVPEAGATLARTLLQATGLRQSGTPLPFSAPPTLFNRPAQSGRALGVGSIPLRRFKAIAKQANVSINDVVLTIVGHALESYQREHGEIPDRPLVALCPLSTREPGDTAASTQIAGILVALGTPGCSVEQRLAYVHKSSNHAKQDADRVSKEALTQYMLAVGAADAVLKFSPFGRHLPPTMNVSVSNGVGIPYRYYIAGGEVVRNYPIGVLPGGAGNAAITVTFGSWSGRMDFSVTADNEMMPDPQSVADDVLDALTLLERRLGTRHRRRKSGPPR